MLTTRKVWFPLRLNIAYFRTWGTRPLDLESRIKQMAILADELYFEPGLLTVHVTEGLVAPFLHSPEGLTEADIRKQREAAKEGEPFALYIGAQPAEAVPAPPEAMRPIGGGPLQSAFIAEYHLLAKEAGLLDLPWVNFGSVDPAHRAEIDEAVREQDQLDFFDRSAPTLSENSLLDGRLKKDLNHDLVVSAGIGMPAMVDALHQPMLVHKAARAQAQFEAMNYPGEQALSVWVPDFTSLPWKDVIALHDHNAIGAFREKLSEAEEEVSHLGPAERPIALAQFGITQLVEEMKKLVPTARGLAVDVALDATVGLLSLGLASTAVTATRGIAELQKAQTEWTAVYLSLVTNPLDSRP